MSAGLCSEALERIRLLLLPIDTFKGPRKPWFVALLLSFLKNMLREFPLVVVTKPKGLEGKSALADSFRNPGSW